MPAKRAYGMDQDFYPGPRSLPAPFSVGRTMPWVALAVIVNLEHWDWELPAGTPAAVIPIGGPVAELRIALRQHRTLVEPAGLQDAPDLGEAPADIAHRPSKMTFAWPLPRVNPTHAHFADQSQSIPDNLPASFGADGAWNCPAGNRGHTQEEAMTMVNNSSDRLI